MRSYSSFLIAIDVMTAFGAKKGYCVAPSTERGETSALLPLTLNESVLTIE
jgi:hypothetical protein